MLTITEQWTPYRWHCSDCGNIVTGYKNSNGDIKVRCERCKLFMVRKNKKNGESTMRLIPPKYSGYDAV